MINEKSIKDFKNPFDAISKFEELLADYTGAQYVITTDCCTHAIELCLRYERSIEYIDHVEFTAYTYLSVPMTMHKLGINYELLDEQWVGEYQFLGTRIWDSARRLERDMYKKSQLQCLSFGRTKPLEIGRGGAILLDDKEAYKNLIRMRYDGRDLGYIPWENQKTFSLGFHYMMRPEECIVGINKLTNNEIDNNYTHKYPDLKGIKIVS